MTKDIKPVFRWAKENGDANIYDRIIMKVMPQLLDEGIKLTSETIESQEKIIISNELFDLILEKTQELIGAQYVQH
jgi:hypothetical protein